MGLTTDDIVEINALYARYNSAIDTGDSAGFAACFTDDAHLDTGTGPQDGREAIGAFAAATHEMLPGLRHQSHNVVVDATNTGAVGSAFLIGYNIDGGYSVLVTGRYADELAHTSDGWRFTRRIFTAD